MVMIPVATVPSSKNRTDDWRTQTPFIDYNSCIRCMICWKFCPDNAILVTDGRNTGSPGDRVASLEAPAIDYDHCKGCGICAYECPEKCIDMSVSGGIQS